MDTSWSLEDAVSHLETGGRTFIPRSHPNLTELSIVAFIPAKQRRTSVVDLIKAIAAHAYEAGIEPEILDRLISIIAKSKHLDQSTLTTLIKNLYPSERVASAIVTKVICCFGPSKSKPSPATQALLLRWLILVYEDLEDQSHLSKLYAVLFDCLDMISLRRSLCHLLSLITRRNHVKPFRVQELMGLLQNVGDDERELLGLLRVFKSYYPEIIVGEANLSRRRANYFFKHPDPEWVAHLKVIQDKEARSTGPNLQTFQAIRRGVKRSRVEVLIPRVQTSRVQQNFTSLEELRNVSDFVQKLDKIELPNQMASALADPLAQKYLHLIQKDEAYIRLESWLTSFLEDELDRLLTGDEEDDSSPLGYVLEVIVGFIRFTKVGSFLCFCKELLSIDYSKIENASRR